MYSKSYRNQLQLALTALPPIACLSLVTWASWGPSPAGNTIAAALVALGGASAVSGLWFALDAIRIRRAFAHLRRGGGAIGATPNLEERRRLHEERQREIVLRLQRQVEQLSAIRDLALIANDDVSFERILERALVVLGGFLDAREIAIYLLEGPGPEPVAVAHRLGERIRVRTGGKAIRVAPREAAAALEARRTIVETGGRAAPRAATLLVADGEIMGALEVRLNKVPLLPEPRDLGRELEGLAKHIALAIRKPTLYDRAVVDGLTKLYTKRHFIEQVAVHMAQRIRLQTPLSLIILDIDHFKSVNDQHGHVAGDLVLAEVAQRVKAGIRAYDQAFRYGGEEVVILAPNTGLEDAVGLAGRLRQRLRSRGINTGETELRITASFGVAEYDPETMPSLEAFVEAADQHLYTAKRTGRDRVVSALDAPLNAPSARAA